MKQSSDNGIPTIHLDKASTTTEQIQTLQRAAFEVGFFYLDSHGVDDEFLAQVMSESKAFFDLPLTKKETLSDKVLNRGYTAMGEETLDPEVQTKGDTKEGYYIGKEIPEGDPKHDPSKFRGPNQWPSQQDLPKFRSTMEQYFQQASSVAHKVVQMLAVALDLDQHHFDPYFEEPMIALRLLRYDQTKSNPEKGIFACGAHSDYGMITLLLTDENPGLQILTSNGTGNTADGNPEWIDVPPRPTQFVVNLGDMLERWTNGKCKSTKHRVLTSGSATRYSIPFFYEPTFESMVECLDSCTSASNPSKWKEPIGAGDYLIQKYKETHSDFEPDQ